jgi:predicted deacylase
MRALKPTAQLYILFIAAFAAAVQAGDDFHLGPLEAPRGSLESGYLAVPPGEDGEARIPVSVLHGARPGPVLALVAGTHGYEYPPITALQRLRRTLDPARLNGTVILVHIANPPSFLGRTIYYSPADGKNLNRVPRPCTRYAERTHCLCHHAGSHRARRLSRRSARRRR